MKILHVETGRHLYGGARQVGYLIDRLAERGVETCLVCAEGHPLAASRATEVFEWRIGGDLDFSLRRRLVELARQYRPDIIHAHSRRGADRYAGRAAKRAGVPAILTRRVQSAEPGFFFRWKSRPYDAIVAISSAVQAELTGFGIPERRLKLIPSAVDTALFRAEPEARGRLAARYSLPPDALIAGAASQLIRRKGIDRLLTLAAKLIETEPRFRLLLFGQGPERLRLERAAHRLGLDRTVIFCGFESELAVLLPGLDVFLHPAEREGLGVAVLEAMSAGVPVVASAVGGIVEVIDDGVDGRLVMPSDEDAWCRAVRELLGDPEQREAIANAARRKVEARFTIDRMTDSYLSVYREVLARRAA